MTFFFNHHPSLSVIIRPKLLECDRFFFYRNKAICWFLLRKREFFFFDSVYGCGQIGHQL
mgnify:CR=1 FL=1